MWPGRHLGVDPGLAGLHHALHEVLGFDVAGLEHLQEARVGLARAVAVHAAHRVGHSLDGVVRELRHVLAVVVVHVRDDPAQVYVAEGHVARLVAQHVLGELLQERARGLAAHVVERRQGEAFDDHVHADHGLGEALRLQRDVDQALEPRRDRIDHAELLDVQVIHLDVSRFVHGLRGRVELGGVVGRRVCDRGSRHERALLTVQELREKLARGVRGERLDLRFGQGLEERHAVEDEAILADDRLGRVDLDAPVEFLLAIPLVLLGLGVQVRQLVDVDRVVEVPRHVHRRFVRLELLPRMLIRVRRSVLGRSAHVDSSRMYRQIISVTSSSTVSSDSSAWS